jgi:type IV pilus assembly protein PilO
MSQRRVWVGGAAAITVLLVIASYFLLIHPKMADAADLRSQKAAQAQANNQLRLDIAQLKSQFASLPAKQAELAVVQQQLPAAPNLPTLIRNLTTIANEAGVSLNSISPSTPSAAVPSSGSATATTSAGLFAIPVTIIVQGDFASNELFLQKIQTEMRRAFLVQTLAITKASAPPTGGGTVPNGTISVSLTGSVFVLQPQAATAPSGSVSAATTTSTPASGSAN